MPAVSLPRACAALLVVAGLAGVALPRAATAGSGAAERTSVGPAPPPAPAVRGLIVRLRDAPAHVAGDEAAGSPGEDADDRRHPDATAVARRRAAVARADERWRAVLAATGLGAEPGLRLEPVGRDAFRVVFDNGHSSARVARWVESLARQPQVRWVVPNERETALQAVPPGAPDDPLFGGLDGQWWLQPAGGGNDDPLAARLRGVPGIQTAWARTTGSPQTVVAVLDTGLTAHPDIDPTRLLPGYDLVSDWDPLTARGYANDGDGRDDDPSDPGDWVDAADRALDPARFGDCDVQASDWHGTAVASFLAASTGNGADVAGALWQGRLLPVRVAGKCGAEVADIVDGMRWAAGLRVCRQAAVVADASRACAEWAPVNPHPARIVNISFGGRLPCNAAYQDAIDELRARGVLVVAAAGNGHGALTRPANCRGVVAVAALNRDGFKATYSNFGAEATLATVGGDDDENGWGPYVADDGLLALANDGATTPGQPAVARHVGTSFAAPIVAGVAALMLGADPALAPDDLAAGLRASVRPHVQSPLLVACSAATPGRCACTTATCGAGILDADRAVAWAQAHAAGARWDAPGIVAAVIDTPELRRAAATGPDLAGAASAVAGNAAAAPEGDAGGGAFDGLELGMLLAAACMLVARRRATEAVVRGPRA